MEDQTDSTDLTWADFVDGTNDTEWESARTVWKPTLMWRIRKAWSVLTTGRYIVSIDYKRTNDGLTVYVDGAQVIASDD